MRGLRLLIKNAFKSAFRNFYQIIGLSMLILLVALIFSLILQTSTSVIDANTKLSMNSNLRDVVVQVDSSKITIDDENKPDNLSWTTSQEIYQEALINNVLKEVDPNATWSRTEGRTFSEIKNNKQSLLIKTVAKFGANDIKTMHPNGTTVDKLVISKGSGFDDDKNVAMHQTVLQQTFAERNGIKIGDIVRFAKDEFSDKKSDQLVVTKDSKIATNLKNELNGRHWAQASQDTEYSNANWFEVVGFGTSADFAAPIIDQTTTLPNIKKDLIAYVDPRVFGFVSTDVTDKKTGVTTTQYDYKPGQATLTLVSNYDREVYYSLKVSNDFNLNTFTTKLNAKFGVKNDLKYIFKNSDRSYLYYQRTHMFLAVANVFNIVATVLLFVIVVIAAATIILMTIKYVEAIQKQIGCLKALGYKKREIVNNFIALPLITSFIGSILGYIISIGVAFGVIKGFQSYFNIDFGGATFNLWSLLASIGGTFLIMLIISYIAAYWVIRRRPLDLLKGEADKQSSRIARGLKKLTVSKSFDGRLRGALMASSAGKLLGMGGVILLSTILMSATVISPKIMKDNETQSFAGLNYENQVEYTAPLWNNPLTFQRTYNPSYQLTDAAKDGWGVQDVNGNIKASINELPIDLGGTDSKADLSWVKGAISTLPYKDSSKTGVDAIDVEKVLSGLLNNRISSDYYSYELQTDPTTGGGAAGFLSPDGSGWAKMGFLGWKSLSMDYLKNMNLATFDPTGLSKTVISTLAKQWPDYQNLIDMFSDKELKDTDLLDQLLKFYKKYIDGLPVEYTVFKGKGDTLDKLVGSGGVYLRNKDLATSITNNGKKGYNAYNFDDVNKKHIFLDENGQEIDLRKLSFDSITSEESKLFYITSLLKWFHGCFFNKMGTILLETSYSRAAYFVQQKMKYAFNNGGQYSLNFNVAPYDPINDDIGTVVNAQYRNKKNQLSDIKLYGINQDQKTINFGNIDISKLESDDDTIPVILNTTAKIKGGFKKGQVIEMSYLMNELQNQSGIAAHYQDDKENTDESTLTKVSLEKFADSGRMDNYTLESQITYYSQDNSYITASSGLSSLHGPVEPALVAGRKIGSETADKSTTAIDSLRASTNGEIKVASVEKGKKFKIIGFQSSYGNPQGWIANTNANKLLKYDVAQKEIYKDIFVPQFKGMFANKSRKYDDTLQNVLGTKKYALTDDYDLLLQETEKNDTNGKIAKTVVRLFNNMFPIYNYKNSLSSVNYDLDQAVNTYQAYGDYSAMGLNGGVDVDTTTNTTVTYTGFGQGATSLIYPVTTARQILEQITNVVNMVIILFIVIALIVSLTMIMLTTSLIIKENMQFIATMKILGYSDRYIVRQILGMYIAGIVIAFVVGIIGAWFGIAGLANVLAVNSSWVLPIHFYGWYPFAVLAILIAVYVISTAAGYANIKKINPLVALQYEK